MATSIWLDPAIEQRVDHLAVQTGRTKAYYLREVVANGLEDLEDYYLAAATLERVRRWKKRPIRPASEKRPWRGCSTARRRTDTFLPQTVN